MTPPSLDPADTRDRLIEAARELFWKHGYASTSISQILKSADARSGSLYYFFPTKEDLLLAVLEKYTTLLCPIVIDPVFERVTDPIERIFGILDGYRRGLIATGFTGGCPIGNLALELADSHNEARKLIARNFEAWRGVISQCLVKASDRLPPGTDTTRIAAFVLSVMEGAVMQSRAHQNIEPFEACVAVLRDYFDHLLAVEADWGGATKAKAITPSRPKNPRQPRRPRGRGK